MDLSREVIDRIVALARPETVEVGDLSYATGQLTLLKKPSATPLVFQGLDGLVAYVVHGPDNHDPADIAIHVESHRQVSVISPFRNPTYQRHEFARAEVPNEDPARSPIGRWIEHEAFMIALAAQFEPTPETEDLQRTAGLITMEETRTSADDGISQEVVAKAGLAFTKRITLPGRVRLRPYRTFREVPQPPSEFVFRARGDNNTGPQLTLLEADGGAWKIQAMAAITNYLKTMLGVAYTVLG